nr:BssA [uncultured bacterium]
MPITERTARLKARCRWKHTSGGEYVDPDVRAGVERARYLTESYKQTLGEPEVIRRAKGLANILYKTTIHIQEDELIVGHNAENPNYLPLYPELSYFATLDMAESEYCADNKEMREIVEWWKPYSLQSKCEPFFTPEERDVLYSSTTTEPPVFLSAFSNVVVNYESVLEDGLNSRIKMIEERLNKAEEKLRKIPWNAQENLPLLDKIHVWHSMIIACKAVVAWARRYSRLARIMAEHFETDPKRKEELLQISDICWRIPAEPARGLKDAMQGKWFTYLICQAYERYASGYAHKEDKLLWPYYKTSVIDKAFQPMTREEAQELVECERLKVSEHGRPAGRWVREVLPGANDLFILTIGGTNGDGSDGCNDMTDVILDAAESIRTTEPSIGFRWNSKGRSETKKRVFNCIKAGLGYPSIKHDELNVAQLVNKFGVPEEQARSWALVLCMSPGVTGRRGTQKTRTEGGSEVRVIKCLELALGDGFDYSLTNKQIGPHTGDPTRFQSFEELCDALRKQLSYAINLAIRAKDISRTMKARYLQCSFISAIDDGCVEEGADAISLAEIPNPWHNTIGNICTVNALAALKKLVFDEKKYTMEELLKALRANWEGYEEMRREFWNAPKFGNDDDYADEIARRFYDLTAEVWGEVKTYSGYAPLPLGQSVATYVHMGPRTGATPDGRKQGEVIDDGGISPYMGTDKKGPTAVLKSVSKVDASKHKGLLLNQRLSPQIIKGEKGFEIWLSYMNTWYDLKCDHVQFNVVSTEEMHAAQEEPEKYQDLIVRVAGYSARFVNLTRFGQDTIIARTVQELGS